MAILWGIVTICLLDPEQAVAKKVNNTHAAGRLSEPDPDRQLKALLPDASTEAQQQHVNRIAQFFELLARWDAADGPK